MFILPKLFVFSEQSFYGQIITHLVIGNTITKISFREKFIEISSMCSAYKEFKFLYLLNFVILANFDLKISMYFKNIYF